MDLPDKADLLEQAKIDCLELTGGRVACRQTYHLPGFSLHVFARVSPHSGQGGGEVHYLTSCASGRITRLLLADICGSAGIYRQMAGAMRSALMKNINAIWQHRVVDQMSRQLQSFATEGGFATASVSTFFAPTRSFAMCNIGNPAPLLFRQQTQQWSCLKGTQKSFSGDHATTDGVYAADDYRYISERLAKNDLVVIYGNGFSQSRMPEGGCLGQSEWLARLSECGDDKPLPRLFGWIDKLLDSGSADSGSADSDAGDAMSEDRTVIVAQATGRRVPLRNNLLAPIRWLHGPRDCARVE